MICFSLVNPFPKRHSQLFLCAVMSFFFVFLQKAKNIEILIICYVLSYIIVNDCSTVKEVFDLICDILAAPAKMYWIGKGILILKDDTDLGQQKPSG